MPNNDPIPHKHLYEVSVEVLDLSEIAARTLARTGITTVGDCIDFFNRGMDALASARSPAFRAMQEVRQKLKQHGYWEYVDTKEQGYWEYANTDE